MALATEMPVEAQGLSVAYPGPFGPVTVLHGIDLALAVGERLGLVGESGSGKSTVALALAALLPPGARVTAERLAVAGEDPRALPAKALKRYRGGSVGMVFQDPMTSLNPVRTVGSILMESVRRHTGCDAQAARAKALAALTAVGIPAPEARLAAYPHQLSGGLRQRCVIALALVNDPRVIVADEPTTALDATTQAQILDLLRQRSEGRALILITHNLGAAADLTDRIAVMYAGRVVETGPTAAVLAAPRHPYTAGLLAAVPRLGLGRVPPKPIPGAPPRPDELDGGCPFAPRCDRRTARCGEMPPLSGHGHAAACWHPLEGGA